MEWYVLITMPRSEKKVAKRLLDMGIESYCPVVKVLKKWSDRKKTVLEPLFRNYVFLRIDYKERFSVLKDCGAVNYLYWLGKPAVIRDHEIETIRAFLNEHDQVILEKASIGKSTAVVITAGAFLHHTGVVQEVRGAQAKVLIDSLGVQLVATLPISKITPAPRG